MEQTLKQQEQLEFANVQYQDKVTSGEQERLNELEQAGILEGELRQVIQLLEIEG